MTLHQGHDWICALGLFRLVRFLAVRSDAVNKNPCYLAKIGQQTNKKKEPESRCLPAHDVSNAR